MASGITPLIPAEKSGPGSSPTAGTWHGFGVAALLGSVLLLAGGASRADEPQQILVRLTAIAVIAISLWPLRFSRLRSHRGWAAGVALAFMIHLAQLVPLPPGAWARLPGHSLYARIAEQAGAVAWRPLSLTPDLTVESLLSLLPATAAALAALAIGTAGRTRLSRWAVGAACASGVLGMLQLAAGGDSLHLFRQSSADSAVGLFANRNHHAAFLACALPLTAAWAGARLRHDERAGIRVAFAAATGLLLISIVATGSRMGLLLAAVGLAGAAWCFVASGHGWRSVSPRGAAMLAAAVTTLSVVGGLIAMRVGVLDRLAQVEPAAKARAELFQPLWATAEAFLPWGAGMGSFDNVFRRFEPESSLSTIYMNEAHNEVLQLLIEGGLPALALLAAFLWWWARTAARIAFAGSGKGRSAMGLAAVAISAMLMLSSLVDYPLRTPLLGALFALACVEMLRTRAALDSKSA